MKRVIDGGKGRIVEYTDKSKFSKKIVIVSIITVLLYTGAVLYFVWHDKFVPDSLTYSFFAMFAVELSALAGIKIKDRFDNYNNEGGYDKWNQY